MKILICLLLIYTAACKSGSNSNNSSPNKSITNLTEKTLSGEDVVSSVPLFSLKSDFDQYLNFSRLAKCVTFHSGGFRCWGQIGPEVTKFQTEEIDPIDKLTILLSWKDNPIACFLSKNPNRKISCSGRRLTEEVSLKIANATSIDLQFTKSLVIGTQSGDAFFLDDQNDQFKIVAQKQLPFIPKKILGSKYQYCTIGHGAGEVFCKSDEQSYSKDPEYDSVDPKLYTNRLPLDLQIPALEGQICIVSKGITNPSIETWCHKSDKSVTKIEGWKSDPKCTFDGFFETCFGQNSHGPKTMQKLTPWSLKQFQSILVPHGFSDGEFAFQSSDGLVYEKIGNYSGENETIKVSKSPGQSFIQSMVRCQYDNSTINCSGRLIKRKPHDQLINRYTDPFQIVLNVTDTLQIAASSGQFCYLTKSGEIFCLASQENESGFKLSKMNQDGEKFTSVIRSNITVCAKNEKAWRCFEDKYLEHFNERDVYAKATLRVEFNSAKKLVMGNPFICGILQSSDLLCWAPQGVKVRVPEEIKKVKNIVARSSGICTQDLNDQWMCWDTLEGGKMIIDQAYGVVLSIAMNQGSYEPWPWGYDDNYRYFCFTTTKGIGCATPGYRNIEWIPIN